MTDYQAELQKIEDDINRLGAAALEPPIDIENATKYVYRLYQRASLNGNLKEFPIVDCAIDKLIPQLRYPDDLYLLKANIAFKLHRLDDVKRNLLSETDEGMKLVADLHFQEGRYSEAKAAYEKAIEKNRTWDNIARYAHFVSKLEDMERADELYLEAEDEITSKQMRSYAWIELQRGMLDLARGHLEDASAHYRRAEKAYSGYWLTDEHIAGLLAAQGRHEEAAALYEDLVQRVAKPELAQALGQLYTLMGQPDRARPYYDRALAEYMASVKRGEVHYYHHLVDVTRNGDAVKWARLDLELRKNFSTQAALAWALYLDGQLIEAVRRINQALSSGVIDAHLFSHAAKIYEAAGRYLNPRLGSFHTH